MGVFIEGLCVLLRGYGYAALLHVVLKFGYGMWDFFARKAHVGATTRGPHHGEVSVKLTALGMAGDIMKNIDRLHDYRHDVVKEHIKGEVGTIEMPVPYAGGFSQFLTTDPRTVKHILKDKFDNWSKLGPADGPLGRNVWDFLGGGIFNLRHGLVSGPEHAKWFHQRKVASNIFARGRFKTLMLDTFIDKANRLIEILENQPARPDQAFPQEVDMQQKFFAYTMDSIMKIFYGRDDVDTLSGTADTYADAYDTAHREMMLHTIKNLPITLLFNMLPYPFGPLRSTHTSGIMHSLYRAHVCRHGVAFERSVATLRETSIAFIDKKKRELRKRTDESPDLLNLFLTSKQKQPQKQAQTRGAAGPTAGDGGANTKPITDSGELCDVVLNFIIAGRDTTACTLSWTFYQLSQNPAVQQRLLEEVQGVLGDQDPTYELLAEKAMPYLNGVIMECLRLHPPVPINMKRAFEDDVLPDGTRCPAGSQLYYFVWGMGRNPERYPDPQKFDPDRWIPFTQPSPYEFPVFQAGPRICLGKEMAMFEAKLLTAMLVRRFQFGMRKEEAAMITYNLSLTMSICNDKGAPADGRPRSHHLWMQVKPRESK